MSVQDVPVGAPWSQGGDATPPMTADRPEMSVEEFEELERHAPETVRLEFINGKVMVKPMAYGNHREIIAWPQRACMQHRPELWLHAESGLKTERFRKARPRADGVLVPVGGLKGQGEWSEADGDVMAVEVTSYDADTHRRDRVEKPDGYAAAGIPVYLLIDRDDCSGVVFKQPEDGRYRHAEKLPFGATVKLPDPVNITLNTEPLKEFVDCESREVQRLSPAWSASREAGRRVRASAMASFAAGLRAIPPRSRNAKSDGRAASSSPDQRDH